MTENNLQSRQLDEICTESEREYVVFGELYNENIIEIMRVRETAGRTEMDKRPFTPDYVKAVITRDNQIIPVVDMRDMIILPSEEETQRTKV